MSGNIKSHQLGMKATDGAGDEPGNELCVPGLVLAILQWPECKAYVQCKPAACWPLNAPASPGGQPPQDPVL